MATGPTNEQQRQLEEQIARDAALADVIAGQKMPPPPGRAHIVYQIAYARILELRTQAEIDLQNGRFDLPPDSFDHHAYQTLYTHLQHPDVPPSTVTGVTERLIPLTAVPRMTRRCPDCSGILEEIRVVDRGHGNAHHDLEYAKVDSQPSPWLGIISTEGRINAFICADCERVFFYGERKKE